MGLFDDSEHELEITSNGGRIDYELRTTGAIDDSGLDGHDKVSDKHVEGHVNGGTDTIGYDGATMNFVFDGDIANLTLKRDGEPVKPAHLKMHVATVEAVNGGAAYGISSSRKMIRRGKAEQSDTRVAENEFEGFVEDGQDKFAFQGTLTGLWSNTKTRWVIDGEERIVGGTPPQGAW